MNSMFNNWFVSFFPIARAYIVHSQYGEKPESQPECKIFNPPLTSVVRSNLVRSLLEAGRTEKKSRRTFSIQILCVKGAEPRNVTDPTPSLSCPRRCGKKAGPSDVWTLEFFKEIQKIRKVHCRDRSSRLLNINDSFLFDNNYRY